MATPTTPQSDQAPPPADDELVIPPPPEEEFWEKFNKRLEFPLGAVGAVLCHVLIGAGLIYVLAVLIGNREDRSGVPLVLVDAGGLDDVGDGSEGSGGQDEPLLTNNNDPFAPKETSPLITDLPDPMDVKNIPKLDDPGASVPPPAGSKTPRKTEQGQGNEKGRGYDGTKGKGPGGSGADSTRARNQRWTIRFKVSDARDYLDQMKSMNAEILVPIPGQEGQFWYFSDLGNPSSKRMASDADKSKLAGQVKFCDNRAQSVEDVARALGLDFKPKEFWAFFPKELEEEMDRKERGYRNRQPEQIERTFFRVVIRGGGYDLAVDDQVVRR